jgi:hypothetical protein
MALAITILPKRPEPLVRARELSLVEAIETLSSGSRTSGALVAGRHGAIVAIGVAIRDASGQPYHPAWRAAHAQVHRFVLAALEMPINVRTPAITVCTSFLSENSDLADD